MEQKKQQLKILYDRIFQIDEEVQKIEDDLDLWEKENTEYMESDYNDATKKTLYPEMYEKHIGMQEKIASLCNEYDQIYEDAEKIKKDLIKVLEEKQNAIESKIKKNNEYIEKLDNKIETAKKELETLKKSKEFLDGDEITLSMVKSLEQEIETNSALKENIETANKDIGEKLKIIEDKIAKLNKNQFDFSMEDEKEEKKEEENTPKGENKEEAEKEQKEDKQEPEKKQNAPKNKGVVGAVIPPQNIELKTEDAKDKEKEENKTPELTEKEKTVRLKKEFESLTIRLKQNKGLSDKDFNRLAEIMSDKENYKKLNITTGIIFNKSKSIIKAMAKSIQNSGNLKADVSDKLGFSTKKASEKNDLTSEMSLKSWQDIHGLNGKKLEAEELVERVEKMDKDALDEEQLEVYNKALSYKTRLASIRHVLAIYDEVVETRKQERNAKVKSVQALLDAPEAKKEEKPSILNSLGEKVVSDSELDPASLEESPKEVKAKEEKVQE